MHPGLRHRSWLRVCVHLPLRVDRTPSNARARARQLLLTSEVHLRRKGLHGKTAPYHEHHLTLWVMRHDGAHLQQKVDSGEFALKRH